ncbi:unnamed protein product [Sphenostylis stenocarpa]|uniref:Uncharacterized protein n=1 Tax=Sphenostylis stenocarpa TaxID=92480 RepID=A0AA86SVE6_9FABA|nr:unnamed protein product [Sphenostylis stenocarpa]
MEYGALESSEKEGQQGASYRYWVRKVTNDAAPLPVPLKLTQEDVPSCQSQSQPATLGSVWNRAGTWEEKSLNNWATPRLKELLISLGSIRFSFGRAEVEDVTKCVGDVILNSFSAYEDHHSFYVEDLIRSPYTVRPISNDISLVICLCIGEALCVSLFWLPAAVLPAKIHPAAIPISLHLSHI